MKKIIIGNWKLNLDHLEAIQLLQKLNYTIEEGKEEEIRYSSFSVSYIFAFHSNNY